MSRISINRLRNTASQATNNLAQGSSTYKSPLSRLGSLKNLSMKAVPFSQHLFHEDNPQDLKAQSSTSFKSEKWSFQPEAQKEERNCLTRSCKMQGENPFLKACLAYANKDSTKEVTRKSGTLDEDSFGEFKEEEPKTTFRLVRKRTLNETVRRTPDGGV